MEGDNPAGFDGDGLAGARIAARAWGFGADLEIAETGDFHVVPSDHAARDELEEGVDHVFRFTLVEANFFKQHVGQLRFGERGCF